MSAPDPHFSEILSAIRKNTRLVEAFEAGTTPNEVKQVVIELLSPYFENKDILDKAAVNILMSEAIAFANLSTNKLALNLFEYALTVHKLAYAKDKIACLQTSIDWQPVIYDGLSVFWSQYHLELDKTNLEADEFLHECLRNIGAITEGLTKPLVKELLQQQRINNGEFSTKGATKDIDFGVVIDELHKASPNPNFFAPNGVRLNQSRNIAQHLSAKVEGTEFVCRYGRPEKEIRLTRDGCYQITRHIYDMFSGLRLANSLFAIDNMPELVKAGLTPQSMRMRNEMEVLHVVSSLASQGFEVIDLHKNENESKLVVKDLTNLDPDQRRFHTAQFVELLWHFAKSPKVIVEYVQKDGVPNFRTIVSADLFIKVEKEQLPATVIAEEAEMIDLKNNFIIPKLRK